MVGVEPAGCVWARPPVFLRQPGSKDGFGFTLAIPRELFRRRNSSLRVLVVADFPFGRAVAQDLKHILVTLA